MESVSSFPVRIELRQGHLAVDGVMVAYEVIPHLLNAIVHPDPRRWFRFERIGDVVHVHVRLQQQEPNGTLTGTIGDEAKPGVHS